VLAQREVFLSASLIADEKCTKKYRNKNGENTKIKKVTQISTRNMNLSINTQQITGSKYSSQINEIETKHNTINNSDSAVLNVCLV